MSIWLRSEIHNDLNLVDYQTQKWRVYALRNLGKTRWKSKSVDVDYLNSHYFICVDLELVCAHTCNSVIEVFQVPKKDLPQIIKSVNESIEVLLDFFLLNIWKLFKLLA